MRVLIDLHRILVYREEEVYGEAQLRRNETGPRFTFCWHTVLRWLGHHCHPPWLLEPWPTHCLHLPLSIELCPRDRDSF